MNILKLLILRTSKIGLLFLIFFPIHPALAEPRASELEPSFVISSDFDGYLIRIYDTNPGSILYSYYPPELDPAPSRYFANWKMVKTGNYQAFSIKSEATGTCMKWDGQNLIHDVCDSMGTQTYQQFIALPESNGGIAIQNLATGLCVWENNSGGDYHTLNLGPCGNSGLPEDVIRGHVWILDPPRSNSIALEKEYNIVPSRQTKQTNKLNIIKQNNVAK